MRYNFSDSESLVKDVEIYKEGKKGLRAVLTAPEGGDVEKLAGLKEKMERNGFSVIADVDDGTDVLRIKGLKSAETFLAALAEDGGVQGNYSVEITEREMKEKKSFGDMIKDNALTLSGVGYLMADSCLISASIMRGALEEGGDREELANGIAWWIPSFFLIAAGNQDPDIVNGFFKRDIKESFDEMGVKVPTEVVRNLEDGAAGRNMWDRVVQTVYDHGPIMNNFMQVFGATKMFSAGQNQGNSGKMAAGAVMGTGMFLGAILPEHEEHSANHKNLGNCELKNPEKVAASNLSISDTTTSTELNESLEVSKVVAPDKQKNGPFSNINPLMISGAGALFNNFANIAGAVDEIMEWKLDKTWLLQKEAKIPGANKTPFLDKDHALHSKVNYDLKRDQLETAYNEADLRYKNAYASASDTAREKFDNLNSDLFKTKDDTLTAQDKLNLKEQLRSEAPDLLDAQNQLNESKNERSAFNKQYEDRARSVAASPLNFVAQVLYIASNRLYMMSSKENMADLDEVGGVNDMLAVSANIIASHPKEEQAALTERLAVMITESKYVDYSLDDVSSVLAAKVDALNNSAWLGNPKNAIVALDLKAAELIDDRKMSNQAQPETFSSKELVAQELSNLAAASAAWETMRPEGYDTDTPAPVAQEQQSDTDLAKEFAQEVQRRATPDSAMDAQDPAFAQEGRVSEQELALGAR